MTKEFKIQYDRQLEQLSKDQRERNKLLDLLLKERLPDVDLPRIGFINSNNV